VHGGNDVDREDVGVDKVRLCLELLGDFEVGESPRVPGLIPVRIELGSSLVGLEDIVVVLERGGTRRVRDKATKTTPTREGRADSPTSSIPLEARPPILPV
jgi:hypothetical protein